VSDHADLTESEDTEIASGADGAAFAADDDVDPLVRLEAERDEAVGDLQRVAAEFANYRKRALREQEAFAARATERLVARLLPVLEDLERALEAAEHHDEAKVIEGVGMTRSALAGVLSAEGVTEIATDGPFDPHVHEALLVQPVEGVESGAVVEVVQKGYLLGDVVLRPSRVIVAE
jgi:molecular chaperone GrpE